MKKHIFTTGMLLFAAYLSAQTVKGVVYGDANGNGKKDKKEAGISNVAITNGRDVVLTNKNGEYELALGNDDIVSVIKPAGYNVPVNADNLPQFFYIYKPEGSPKTEFAGVQPTGKLPKSVDFGLTKAQDNETFTALIFGDPQPYNLEEVDYYARGVVAEVINSKNVSFGLSMGDLVGNDLSLFNPYIQATKKTGLPWYNLLGNHDLNFDVEKDEMADETYEAHFGPANYAFNYGKVHFIVLDDVMYPDPRDSKGYWGGFREDQFQFIENDLKLVPKDHLIVLAFHIPISEPDAHDDSFRDEDRNRLFKVLKDFPYTLSLSAHTHLQRQDFFSKGEGGWLQEKPHHHYNVGTTSGDWYSGKLDEKGIPISVMRDGTPKGYAFIHFNGNQYTIDYKAAGKPKEHQMEVFAPKVVAKGKRTKAGVFVNFFMGSKNDKLEYRVDGGEWKHMEYTETADPSYVELVYEWDLAEELMPGRRSSDPVASTHVWRGNIPANLEAGEHKIEIKATDMFGQIHTAVKSYRIEMPK
ncbi:calcineurin-like phosphoesterase C-terminal domain-containing protein [Flavobacterium beibuense]|uniref:Metallophosphoesterase n=1 Tax=Flavobacterium beibuense TaxID=657326 RepID=A0A444WC13_9FLAO|nr:calcineurin-like phosphoesterase family protein [Flavobacterium beibuense]RYJ43360.1 Metallophosphoesterase [Flavobacterium beibuense]